MRKDASRQGQNARFCGEWTRLGQINFIAIVYLFVSHVASTIGNPLSKATGGVFD